MNFITKTPIQLLCIAATPNPPPAGNVVVFCGGTGSLKIIDSAGTLNVIATMANVNPKLDAEKQYANGVSSSFFHTSDGGGYDLHNSNDNSLATIKFEAVEDNPIKMCLSAVDFLSEEGTRIIQTLSKVYYTKDGDNYVFSDNDELATIASIPTKLSQLTNDNNYVADASYVHTDSNYTAAEKTKLAALDENHFKGSYATLSALEAAHPTAEDGDYAYVGTEGTDAVMYIWDNSDEKWVLGGNPTAETPASVKEKYESNSDTNAYTDSEKSTVATVGNVANLTTTTKTSTVAAINEIVTDLADYVPKTRTVNGKALSSNITITNYDIGSEPSITAGTTSQYWRGDKTWATFPKMDNVVVDVDSEEFSSGTLTILATAIPFSYTHVLIQLFDTAGNLVQSGININPINKNITITATPFDGVALIVKVS